MIDETESLHRNYHSELYALRIAFWEKTKMWKDEIVEEVHRVREEYAAKFDHDLDAMYEDIKRREAESKREFVSFPPRRPEIYPAREPAVKKA